jgi:hypothetical protein
MFSKSVSKTPCELWTGRKPNFNYLHVSGYPIEAKIFNPKIEKLDSKTIICQFIGYPKKSKGYRFYCLGMPQNLPRQVSVFSAPTKTRWSRLRVPVLR